MLLKEGKKIDHPPRFFGFRYPVVGSIRDDSLLTTGQRLDIPASHSTVYFQPGLRLPAIDSGGIRFATSKRQSQFRGFAMARAFQTALLGCFLILLANGPAGGEAPEPAPDGKTPEPARQSRT